MTTTYKLLMEQVFFEKLSNDPRAKAHKAALSQGLQHLGGGTYGKEKGQPATHKIDSTNKLVVIPPEEREADPTNTPTQEPQNKPTSAGTPVKKIPTDKPIGQKAHPELEFTPDQFMDTMSSRLKDSLSKFNKSANLKGLEVEYADDFKKFYHRVTTAAMLPPGKKRREILEDIISNFNISLGPNKVYANHFSKFGGLYKVFGDSFGKDAQFFMNMVTEDGLSLSQSSDKKENLRQYLSAQGKPDYGKPHKYSDDNVKQLFDNNPILADLSPRFKSVFGPTGPDGLLLQSGGDNARTYFAHSVQSNKAVDKLIAILDDVTARSGRPADTPIGPPGISAALKRYKMHMQMALDRFDNMPAPGRGELIGQIYAKLAHDMHMADAEIGGTIMKNLAEMCLYDTELAAGHEAYLPSEGNFPTGDKIVVTRKGTKVERIETISVKYGKNGSASYGMPAEAAKVCLYHPDARMRDVLDGRAGRAGYETGATGLMIHDQSNFAHFAEQSGFANCFSPEQLEKIRMIGVEITLITQNFKRNHAKQRRGEISAGELGGLENDPAMQQQWQKLARIIHGANQQELLKLLGTHNHKQLLKPGKFAMSIYSMMAFGTALSSSEGFSIILHNHQEYRNGKFISKTNEGSSLFRDWQTTFIPYGDRAGGLKVGFNRLTDDSQ